VANWDFDDALRVAAKHGRYDIVAPLLQVAALLRPLAAELTPLENRLQARRINQSKTALHMAAEYGHDNVIPLLLAEDDPRPRRDTSGRTPLHLAAEAGHGKVVAQLLAHRPDDSNLVDCRGRTALHLAVIAGKEEIVDALLACNPQLIDVTDNQQTTSLHFAASSGNVSMAAKLLALKPSLYCAKTKWGRTALQYAAHEGQHEVVAQLLPLEQPENYHKAFCAAVRRGCVKTVKLFLAAGARVNLPTVVCAEHKAIFELLLAHNPDVVKEEDANHCTLLHNLPSLKDSDTLKLVLTMFPDSLRWRNLEGHTPFHLALYDHDHAVELMQWHLTFDEIVDCAVDNQIEIAKKRNRTDRSQRLAPFRFKAVIEAQCEDLQLLLSRDVLPLVLDYLGFAKPTNKKRKHTETSSGSSDSDDSAEELSQSP